jgi:hypothetical protein
MSVWSERIDTTKEYTDLRTMEKVSGRYVKQLLEASEGDGEMEAFILMTFVRERTEAE